jgi:hypothetical protein
MAPPLSLLTRSIFSIPSESITSAIMRAWAANDTSWFGAISV